MEHTLKKLKMITIKHQLAIQILFFALHWINWQIVFNIDQ